jgi:hypothetical protein
MSSKKPNSELTAQINQMVAKQFATGESLVVTAGTKARSGRMTVHRRLKRTNELSSVETGCANETVPREKQT